MSYDVIAGAPISQHAPYLILGDRLPPERAIELIRISDRFFWGAEAETTYEATVKRLLGVPLLGDYDRLLSDGRFDGTDMLGLEAAQKSFQARWGAVSWDFLGCAQIGHATGWCYPDGTIARADEFDGWVYPNEIFDDGAALAAAFPELAMSVVVWGNGRLFANGLMLHEAPEGPWSDELRDAVLAPSHGFVVRGGRIDGVRGDDPDLFGGYGYATALDAIEATFQAHRRLDGKGVVETRFGDRARRWDGGSAPRTGLPDAVIDGWVRIAQDRGLVGG